MKVRDARPDDAAAVAAVHVRAWQAAYRGLIADEQLDALNAEERAGRYAFGSADPAAPRTLLAVERGEVRGFATVVRSRDADLPRLGELAALYVDPLRWQTGVGSLLLSHACADFAERGFAEALLWVLVGNEPAARFYRARGWRPDGARRSEDTWGVAVEVVRYRRTLAGTSAPGAGRAPA